MEGSNILQNIIKKSELKDFREFIGSFGMESKFYLRNDILLEFDNFCSTFNKTAKFKESSSIKQFINKIQELFVTENYITIMHRYAIARYNFYLLRVDGEYMEEISKDIYLDQKDLFVTGDQNEKNHLHIDFMPFYDFSPSLKDPKKLGKGIIFLNRYLSSNIFNNPDEWNNKLFEFIKLHKYEEQQLLLNGLIIKDFQSFYNETEKIMKVLETRKAETPYKQVEQLMKKAGFEPGWGNTVGRILETMQIMLDLFHEPTDELLETFISRVPMPLISKIAIISPHGWFGQENVLGRPDTGGQVIYILDQVRALEKHLKKEIELTGLTISPTLIVITRLIPDADGTTCNQKKEKIFQTENGWILRIPFRDDNMNVVRHWISRFHIWPYLEQFAEDTSTELLSELGGRPDLIIGNYSDGNLVASLLSDRLDVVQCTIAHALEKTKYLFSDMYWQDNEPDYNFSLQFTADLLSMNKSDFIISSTYQEIAGTEYSMGQYESYQFFSLPGLYQVKGGINLFSPKFNIIPPGVDEDLYFPYFEKEKRTESKSQYWHDYIYHKETDDTLGSLADPEKIPIFTMARFDKIKNITGLIEAFGSSEKLQKNCNLIFAAGSIHAENSSDMEEKAEIEKAHALINQYDLFDKVRWLPSINKLETGEVYRSIADKKGIFVQPALFEAFGLTILEAMLSGLPTFGPKFGGPLEIIEDTVCGFLMNTSKPVMIAESIEHFITNFQKNPSHWEEISRNGISRVKEYFTWNLYSERLIKLAKLYGFWRYSVSGKGMIKMDRYSDFIYHFLLKKRSHIDGD